MESGSATLEQEASAIACRAKRTPRLGHASGNAILGWRTRPDTDPQHDLVVLVNFEPYDIPVDLELGRAGSWRKLADIRRVTDGSDDTTALDSRDGRFAGFTLPSSSGFVYRFGANGRS